ncbi:MAG: right-handed parallel beta-helix repeat-containing protein [Desulfobacteraceae bacterium]|nr:right-handed parallel beta-helix repeat-containing protein [Desulfobacteraceae bacterium]
MRSRLIISLVAFLCIGSGTVFAGTIHVPTAEYPTIQAGIDAASNGDTVLVADGTYTGDGNKNIDFGGRAITVMSENGPEGCIIDGEGVGLGFNFHSFETPSSILEGFTITNFDERGMKFETSHPTISNCIIKDNENSIYPQYGGGIHCTNASPTFIDCEITNNTANQGGGMFLAHAGSKPIITNCIFAFNGALSGGAIDIYNTAHPVVTNCTFTQNTASTGGAVFWAPPGTNATVTNCIVWNNFPDVVGGGGDGVLFTYCDIEGGWTGEGNIDEDPLFVDPILDFHLTGSSPCINAGTNDAPELPDEDMDDLPRIIDGTVDMGAYEFAGSEPDDDDGGGGWSCFISTPLLGIFPISQHRED